MLVGQANGVLAAEKGLKDALARMHAADEALKEHSNSADVRAAAKHDADPDLVAKVAAKTTILRRDADDAANAVDRADDALNQATTQFSGLLMQRGTKPGRGWTPGLRGVRLMLEDNAHYARNVPEIVKACQVINAG